jgi:hypothetical protein
MTHFAPLFKAQGWTVWFPKNLPHLGLTTGREGKGRELYRGRRQGASKYVSKCVLEIPGHMLEEEESRAQVLVFFSRLQKSLQKLGQAL